MLIKYFLLIIIVISCSRCHMLNIFDLEPPPSHVTRHQQKEAKERDQFYKDMLLGRTQEEVVKLLGEPEQIYKENQTIKDKNDIEFKYTERWCYSFYDNGKYGGVHFGINVYFLDNVVVF